MQRSRGEALAGSHVSGVGGGMVLGREQERPSGRAPRDQGCKDLPHPDCAALAGPLTLTLWAETQGPRSQGQSVQWWGEPRQSAPVHPRDYRLPASHFPSLSRGSRPLSCLRCLLKDTVSH